MEFETAELLLWLSVGLQTGELSFKTWLPTYNLLTVAKRVKHVFFGNLDLIDNAEIVNSDAYTLCVWGVAVAAAFAPAGCVTCPPVFLAAGRTTPPSLNSTCTPA